MLLQIQHCSLLPMFTDTCDMFEILIIFQIGLRL